MSATPATVSAHRPEAGQLLLALAILALPLAVFFWLLRLPAKAPDPGLGFEHLVVVLNVSVLALLVAVLVARSAIQLRAFRTLLLALGFMALAGFFSVHALATPGVILPPSGTVFSGGTYHDSHGAASVLGISAFLSLLLPAVFFAARYLPLDWRPTRSWLRWSKWLAGAIVVVLVVYAALGLKAPDTVALLPLLNPPFTYVAAAFTILLLLFAAWRQGQEYLGSRLPMQAAQVAAFLLLADAVVAMILSPIWSLAWWEYHVIMLLAVLTALWALFIELDRRRGFERFVSPAVVERVMAGDAIPLGGERRTVTILFGDLRGSTALAEKLPAEGVVAVLNTYVGAMAQCVFEQGGVLDKFLGDGLMAIFGVMPDPSFGAVAAANTVQAIRLAIGAVNDARVKRGEPIVNFGTGVHTGEVVLGAVGLPQRSDYTAIGDTVNTASRLESLCKEFHVDCVISADAAVHLDGGFSLQALGSAQIRGKEHELEVFTLAL
ncbi:MAG: adenylate/guanylate cyclase domain-containing protein [Chloroflexi bacterium]|nr:adenylate/guanylate cyclase domain-containing protein [Chloroflexota bacterium]